jgi:hypothetical protein
MKLTKETIATLRAPAGIADHIEWDDSLPGFGVRLRGHTRFVSIASALGNVVKLSATHARSS